MERFTSCAALLSLTPLVATAAHASTQVLADTTLVSGSSSEVFTFQAPGPGTVTAELTNIDWPQNLTSMNFLAGAGSEVLAQWSADSPATGTVTQTLTFNVANNGTYFANVMATAGGS